jgi:2-keto-3-deoxy-6-phosphogluconate aldolase
VNAGNAAEFIAAGAFALGVGADLVDAAALRAGNLEKIKCGCSELLQAVASAREALRAKTGQA